MSTSLPPLPLGVSPPWQGGAYVGVDDRVLLRAAAEQNLSLVTHDLRTIPPLFFEWGQLGISQLGGIVFVDERSIAPNDIGGLVRALIGLWDSESRFDWRDRLVYLRSAF